MRIVLYFKAVWERRSKADVVMRQLCCDLDQEPREGASSFF